ncbi:hypothetical protein BBO99_00008134 [Phytophthora kernoviae]|uniref:BCAS3 WD40 domain-containing protein n=2 Tax=Phytophthora kernoviae TaxID=325452 RepID=A0A421EWG5_9STRA|nr:hypothetical protein G195_008798 [Phytophthora kernoviae 00238/432]KAG2513577.1 hypothetical protein JM16_007909 [Phytophthora kernoviae]KAG2519383.1 hypothetical protein JM18_007571 [Phytophthora kernoviae]RLN06349.1 hypothetical protein BBI17_008064 [Phytophthora kernoviae]RLN75693.1 hypothetical protein BBO99_00008134 [Phytophthora kernoviae]
MKSSARSTCRASARTSRHRAASGSNDTQSSYPDPEAPNKPSVDEEGSLEVTFCAVQRVGGRLFLALCTHSHWRLYRLDGFSASRDSCTPVQLVMNPTKAPARLSDVRFFHLYQLPESADLSTSLGGIFISERSISTPISDDEDNDFVAAVVQEEDDVGHEDISVMSLDEQRLLHKLPSSPSLVLDVQTNATMAAVICETRELFLYDLSTFQLQQCLLTASPAMALGARWLAYPGFAQDAGVSRVNGQQPSLTSSHGDSDSDYDDIPIEALVNGGVAVEARDASHSSSPSYTAIDVAQNVASGLYYLSEFGRATIAPSYKGQNLHVFRLSPPLQSVVNKSNATVVGGHGTLHHQLLYKLQRGITHASIQDIAFSQDGKWINVTSAHGTSHLYVLHPEGARVSADTHANTVVNAAELEANGLGPGFPQREVNDFYADFRVLETRTQTQVLRIRHELKLNTVSTVTPHKSAAVAAASKPRVTRTSSSSSSSSMSSTSSSSSPPGISFHSPPTASSMRSSTIMESALDASQALLSQLATSAMDFGHQHFENDMDVDARRRRLRRRLCCMFAPDGLKMLICCNSVLKLYTMRVTALSQYKADRARITASDSKTKSSKSSLSSFGFEASVTEMKSWELLAQGRRKSATISSAGRENRSSSSMSNGSTGDVSTKSELRTFTQRSLPLWAHPKVTFRSIDEDHPEGQVLEVKRKGPNPSQDLSASTMALAPEGYANGDEQLFVMEMDSYFGIGESPVFDGRGGGRPATPEVPPPLDLASSINLAISSSLPETPPKPIPETNNTRCFQTIEQNSPPESNSFNGSSRKGNKKKAKNRRVPTPPSSSEADAEVITEGGANGGITSLQFTLQDMYFAVPSEETS